MNHFYLEFLHQQQCRLQSNSQLQKRSIPKNIFQSLPMSESDSHSQSNSQNVNQENSQSARQHSGEHNRKKRYKYCCRKCKHSERGKKSCVCVVPLPQRRTAIGNNGCQTCSCTGCSIEDFLKKGQDPEYRPDDKFREKQNSNQGSRQNPREKQGDFRRPNHHQDSNYQRSRQKDHKFQSINGCCRNCMKAFSKNQKSCLCQVPKNVRKVRLPPGGCKICGCDGCNPRDRSHSYSSSRSRSRSPNSSSISRRSYDEKDHNFNNIDRSQFGKVIAVQYNLNPGMLGLGIPQRTSSYILGRPQ